MRVLCLRAINLGFGFTEEVAVTVRKHFKRVTQLVSKCVSLGKLAFCVAY